MNKMTLVTLLAVCAVVLPLTLIVQRCTNKSKDSKVAVSDSTKADTNYVFGFYVPPENNNVKYDLLLRITRPDSGMVALGSGLFKKGMVRDSIYGYPLFDTMRDGKRVPLKDSLGRIKMQFQYMFVPKQKVWDLGILSDSVVKRFSGILVKPDSAHRK